MEFMNQAEKVKDESLVKLSKPRSLFVSLRHLTNNSKQVQIYEDE